MTFHRLSGCQVKGHAAIRVCPQGVAENVGDALGVVSLRVQGDLERFKEFIAEAWSRDRGMAGPGLRVFAYKVQGAAQSE